MTPEGPLIDSGGYHSLPCSCTCTYKATLTTGAEALARAFSAFWARGEDEVTHDMLLCVSISGTMDQS